MTSPNLPAIIARVKQLDEAARDLKAWCVHARDDDTAQVYATARGLCRQVVPVAETTPELGPLIAEYRTAAPALATALEAAMAELEECRATLRASDTVACEARDEADAAEDECERLRAENERLREALVDLADEDCEYRDNCPSFGTRHGRCTGCKARLALEGTK